MTPDMFGQPTPEDRAAIPQIKPKLGPMTVLGKGWTGGAIGSPPVTPFCDWCQVEAPERMATCARGPKEFVCRACFEAHYGKPRDVTPTGG